ncbi:hypothetical protein COLO4_08603 [Corchorus olitorius]|uniref:Uncharacterized protein n=1 Tax=Corchorus olitorius TaxID=93759 RepID=A0A1R3KF73_9ROSI|nr:hypothetical protein COLO4_08603 [Corchorus olitorius]
MPQEPSNKLTRTKNQSFSISDSDRQMELFFGNKRKREKGTGEMKAKGSK